MEEKMTAQARRQLHGRYRKRAEEILFHRCLYYVFDKPELTDAEYDALERDFEKWEVENIKDIHPESPSQKVGSSIWEDYPVMVRARVRSNLFDRGIIEEMYPEENDNE